MTTQPKPGRITTGPNGRPVIAGPWPSYRQFRDLPERERWVLYATPRHAAVRLKTKGSSWPRDTTTS